MQFAACFSASSIRRASAKGARAELPEGIPVITVGAKCDLGRKEGCDVLVSAVTGEGMETLKKLMFERGYGRENGEAYLMEERHYRAAERALEAVKRALSAIRGGLPPELYAEDMR